MFYLVPSKSNIKLTLNFLDKTMHLIIMTFFRFNNSTVLKARKLRKIGEINFKYLL